MRKCTVCIHPEVEKINEALVRGESYRTISHTFSISEHALKRHAKNHLPKELAKAKEFEEVARADNLLEKIKELQEKTLSILKKAEEKGDLRTCLNAIREARENLELLAKLQGDVRQQEPIQLVITSDILPSDDEDFYPEPIADNFSSQRTKRN